MPGQTARQSTRQPATSGQELKPVFAGSGSVRRQAENDECGAILLKRHRGMPRRRPEALRDNSIFQVTGF